MIIPEIAVCRGFDQKSAFHDRDVLAHGFGHEIPARWIRPLFSYLMAKASGEACAEINPKPFHVSRCAIAGTQAIASTWTGDNYTDFEELRYNHYQAMTMALFTSDSP